MAGTQSLYSQDIINESEITERIEYLEFLDADWEGMTESEREVWEDDREELADLRNIVADLGEDMTSLVSEGYWSKYAEEDADDSFDLMKTGAYAWFDYDSYADDLQSDYTGYKFGDDTYYHIG